MPFDGTDFEIPRDPPERAAPGDRVAIQLILIVGISALVTPISVVGFADLVHYFLD